MIQESSDLWACFWSQHVIAQPIKKLSNSIIYLNISCTDNSINDTTLCIHINLHLIFKCIRNSYKLVWRYEPNLNALSKFVHSCFLCLYNKCIVSIAVCVCFCMCYLGVSQDFAESKLYHWATSLFFFKKELSKFLRL